MVAGRLFNSGQAGKNDWEKTFKWADAWLNFSECPLVHVFIGIERWWLHYAKIILMHDDLLDFMPTFHSSELNIPMTLDLKSWSLVTNLLDSPTFVFMNGDHTTLEYSTAGLHVQLVLPWFITSFFHTTTGWARTMQCF